MPSNKTYADINTTLLFAIEKIVQLRFKLSKYIYFVSALNGKIELLFIGEGNTFEVWKDTIFNQDSFLNSERIQYSFRVADLYIPRFTRDVNHYKSPHQLYYNV